MGVRGKRKMIINSNHELAWLGGVFKIPCGDLFSSRLQFLIISTVVGKC